MTLSTIRLRWWLPILAIASAVLMLLTSVGWQSWQAEITQEANARARLKLQLAHEQYILQILMGLDNRALIADELAYLGSIPEVDLVVLVDAQGQVIYSSQRLAMGKPLSRVFPEFSMEHFHKSQQDMQLRIDVDAERRNLLAFQPIALLALPRQIRSSTVGGLLLRYDLTESRALAQHQVLVFAIVQAAFAFFLIAILTVVLRRWFSQPLIDLQKLVRRISQKDLSTPVAIAGRGELAELATAINGMQADLDLAAKEREKYLDNLRESEQGLAITLQSIGDGVIATCAAGRITRMNTSAERLTGWTLDAALGRPLSDVLNIINADTREKMINPAQQVMESGEAVGLSNNTVLLTRDGRELQIEELASAIRNADGQIVGVVLIFRDVTDDYHMRRDLAHTTEMLERTGEMAKVGGWELDLKTNQAIWTKEIYRIHEADPSLDPSAALGLRDLDPESQQLAQRDLEAAINYGTPWDRETPMTTWTGRHLWIRSQGYAICDAGKPIKLIGTIQDITERKQAESEIENLAFYDPLTGLPNRRRLLDRLAHVLNNALRHQQYGALLFIDLDNFKTLNDTQGHDQGDKLLKIVAERLSASIRKGDTLARLGGDEFVVLLEALSTDAMMAAAEAQVVAEKIIVELGRPYTIDEKLHRSTPSIGITLFGDVEEPIEEPLKRADLAMYQAKTAGRNTWCFYDPKVQEAIAARSKLEIDLRSAIAEQQLVLYYQPQISSKNTIAGVEALVRWRHPQRGMVSPAEFIPLAEETDLILPVGRWVLDTACAQLASWAADPERAHLSIAVNVSSRQFHQVDFVDQVLAAIAATNANPQRLKLELTESLLVSNIEDVVTKMYLLKQSGVGFSLDDFGTGYSSLSYLKRLPLDQLKIDQSFVRDILIDPNDASIAKTIIDLAKSLGLNVIAEGVETQAQRNFLEVLGCPAYQGYLFSRPLPIDELESFMSRL